MEWHSFKEAFTVQKVVKTGGSNNQHEEHLIAIVE